MGYEIDKVTDLTPETIHNYTVVSGRASKARYAFASLKSSVKSKLSDIFSAENKNTPYDEELLGVDITPSCIYVCQIDNKGGGHALTGLASVCMSGKFVGEDILNNPNLYSESLKKLVRENKIKTKKVAISLPVSSSIVRVATILKMNDDEISRAIKYGSLWKNLMSQNDSPDNYSIFYQVIRREDSCETMDILLVATKLADINLYKDIVMKSGLMPVVIDAKGLAIHHALKNRPFQNGKAGTVLIEFGLEDNYVIAMSDSTPRVFNMELSVKERAAIIGYNTNGNDNIVDELVKKYTRKINAIKYHYNKLNASISIEDIYVMSSLPLIKSFIPKLEESLKNYKVKEYSMFDYLIIDDNFCINKESATNNISSWSSSICMAIFPWSKRSEEWIEIRQSPEYGTTYLHHKDKPSKLPDISIKTDDFAPENISNINIPSNWHYPITNFMALAAAVFSIFIIYKSYNGLIEEGKDLASNDVALDTVESRYQEKYAKLASLNDITSKFQLLKEASISIEKENNQEYVLSIYNYLDTVLQQGVWLKELTFNAPNDIEIEGRSIDDSGVMSFLGTMSGSKMFSKMALKHIQSIRELDLYAQNSVPLKSFILKGNLSETLPGEYLNKPNFVAGGMAHGG